MDTRLQEFSDVPYMLGMQSFGQFPADQEGAVIGVHDVDVTVTQILLHVLHAGFFLAIQRNDAEVTGMTQSLFPCVLLGEEMQFDEREDDAFDTLFPENLASDPVIHEQDDRL